MEWNEETKKKVLIYGGGAGVILVVILAIFLPKRGATYTYTDPVVNTPEDKDDSVISNPTVPGGTSGTDGTGLTDISDALIASQTAFLSSMAQNQASNTSALLEGIGSSNQSLYDSLSSLFMQSQGTVPSYSVPDTSAYASPYGSIDWSTVDQQNQAISDLQQQIAGIGTTNQPVPAPNVMNTPPTSATNRISGSNPNNQTQYLQGLKATGTTATKNWANQALYAENLLSTGNAGQKKWAQAELDKLYGTNNSGANKAKSSASKTVSSTTTVKQTTSTPTKTQTTSTAAPVKTTQPSQTTTKSSSNTQTAAQKAAAKKANDIKYYEDQKKLAKNQNANSQQYLNKMINQVRNS